MKRLSTHSLVVTATATFFAIGCGGAIDSTASDGTASARVNGEPGADAGPPPSSPPDAPRSCPDVERSVIASGIGFNVGWIAVDASHVYFGSIVDSRLQRVAKSGGPVETLFNGLASIDLAVTLTTTSLVFAHAGGVVRLPKAGGTPAREQYSGPDGISSIAADEAGIALLTSDSLVRCKWSEPCTHEHVGGGFGAKLAMDDDWIYYRRPKGDSYALVRTARSAITSVHEELVAGISLEGNIVLGDDRVYFSSSVGRNATLSSVSKLPGHTPVTLAEKEDPWGWWFAVDARWVYPLSPTNGTILVAPHAGATPATVFATSKSPAAVASDGQHVYWFDSEEGVVYRTRTPC